MLKEEKQSSRIRVPDKHPLWVGDSRYCRHKEFACGIWGDMVIIASRMESGCETGKINVSGSTFELVKNRFDCTCRGKMQAKTRALSTCTF